MMNLKQAIEILKDIDIETNIEKFCEAYEVFQNEYEKIKLQYEKEEKELLELRSKDNYTYDEIFKIKRLNDRLYHIKQNLIDASRLKNKIDIKIDELFYFIASKNFTVNVNGKWRLHIEIKIGEETEEYKVLKKIERI